MSRGCPTPMASVPTNFHFDEALERQIVISRILLNDQTAMLDAVLRSLENHRLRRQFSLDVTRVLKRPRHQSRSHPKPPPLIEGSKEERAYSLSFTRFASDIRPTSPLDWILAVSTHSYSTPTDWMQHILGPIDHLTTDEDSAMMLQLLCCFVRTVLVELQPTLDLSPKAPKYSISTMEYCINIAVGRTLFHAYVAYPETTARWLEGAWDAADSAILRSIAVMVDSNLDQRRYVALLDLRDRYFVRWRHAKMALEGKGGKHKPALRQAMLTIEDTWTIGMRCIFQDLRAGQFPSSTENILALLLFSWAIDSVDSSTTFKVEPSDVLLSGIREMMTLDTTDTVLTIARLLWPQHDLDSYRYHFSGLVRGESDCSWINLSEIAVPGVPDRDEFSTSKDLLRRLLLRQNVDPSRSQDLGPPFPDLGYHPHDVGSSLAVHASDLDIPDFPDYSMWRYAVPTKDSPVPGLETDRFQNVHQLALSRRISGFFEELDQTAETFMATCALSTKFSQTSVIADALQKFVLEELATLIPISIATETGFTAAQHLYCDVNSGDLSTLQEIEHAVYNVVVQHSHDESNPLLLVSARRMMEDWKTHVRALGVEILGDLGDAGIYPVCGLDLHTALYTADMERQLRQPPENLWQPQFEESAPALGTWNVQPHALNLKIPDSFHAFDSAVSTPEIPSPSAPPDKRKRRRPRQRQPKIETMREMTHASPMASMDPLGSMSIRDNTPPPIVWDASKHSNAPKLSSSISPTPRKRRNIPKSPSLPKTEAPICPTSRLALNNPEVTRSDSYLLIPVKSENTPSPTNYPPPSPGPAATLRFRPPQRSRSTQSPNTRAAGTVPCSFPGCLAVLANKSLWARHLRATHQKKLQCGFCPKQINNRADYLTKHAKICRGFKREVFDPPE